MNEQGRVFYGVVDLMFWYYYFNLKIFRAIKYCFIKIISSSLVSIFYL